MLPRVPLPRVPLATRERNERRPSISKHGERCIICETPLADDAGKVGLNYNNPTDEVCDPTEDLPAGGLLFVGSACAKKVPSAYRIKAP